MKKLKIIAIAFVALAVVSCKKDNPQPKFQNVKYNVLCYGCTVVIDDELGEKRTFNVKGKFDYEFTNFNFTEVNLKVYPINPFGIPIMAQASIATNDGKRISEKRGATNVDPIELTLKVK